MQEVNLGEAWFYEKGGQSIGPVAEETLKLRAAEIGIDMLVWTNAFGNRWKRFSETQLYDGPPLLPKNLSEVPAFSASSSPDDEMIRRIVDYERISGILWIGIGIIQILLIYTIIAGIWNIFAGISRIRMVRQIKKRDINVPAQFEGIAQLVIIGLINLFVGGLVGLVFVALDFFIRDKVLSNRQLFNVDEPSTA